MTGSTTRGPLVSIITPTFNRAKLVGEAIESVLQQTYPSWELLVWDDGSTDETPDLVKIYNDPRIRWCRGKNRGKCHALNQAIARAQGEIVAFLDDDDLWKPNKLEIQVKAMISNSQIDVLFTNFENLDLASGARNISFQTNKSLMARFRTELLGDRLWAIKDGLWDGLVPLNVVLPSTTVVRKAMCGVTGVFNEMLRASEDMDYWFRMALMGARFAYTGEVLVVRRKSKGSLSNRGERTHLEHIAALNSCLVNAQRAGRKEIVRIVKNASGDAWENMIRLYLAEGKPWSALDAFRRRCRYGMTGRALVLAACSFFGPTALRLFGRTPTAVATGTEGKSIGLLKEPRLPGKP